jgi:effector-binding domain-containing protein
MIAAVHARLAVGEAPGAFRRYLDQVYALAKTGAVQLDGQNVFFYQNVPDAPGEVDIAFGVGVKTPFIGSGQVQPTLLPAGEVAVTTHLGSYSRLGEAHAAVVSSCRVNGLAVTGARWEIYGHWTSDESQLRTDVLYLLAPAAS